MPTPSRTPPAAPRRGKPADTATLDPQAAQVLRRFRVVFNAVRTHFGKLERKTRLSGAQVWVLSLVRDQPGIGVGALARAMDVHQSTASNLLPSMKNSFIVACAVVLLNLLVGVPAAYALAKIRFIGRSGSMYFMLTTRVIPDIALVVPFFLFVQKLGLMDSLWSLVIT